MGIWNTKDYKGQPVTWYSADIIEKIKGICKDEVLNCDDYQYPTCNNCPSSGECSSEFAGHILSTIERANNGKQI